jgi:uncharacterized membrane protein YeaQ/YmgE (transglycosylase-associated protein family)
MKLATAGVQASFARRNTMNPEYGIIMWVVIGALAGWIGSKIMHTDAQQGGIANIIIGVIGAVVGGFIARAIFGDRMANNGMIASFFVALAGACLVIGLRKMITGRRRYT